MEIMKEQINRIPDELKDDSPLPKQQKYGLSHGKKNLICWKALPNFLFSELMKI